VPGVLSVLALPGRVEIVIDRSTENLDRIVKLFSNATILDISIKEPDLEDVFLELAR